MTKIVALSRGLGEIMAPGTLVTVLMLSPDGTITVEPGALHGRSTLEQSFQFVSRREQLTQPQSYRLIWVGVELDPSNQPLRYKGLGVSELFVDPSTKQGYKNVAESVNRMSDTIEGRVNIKVLSDEEKSIVRQQLLSLGADLWQRSPQRLQEALR